MGLIWNLQLAFEKKGIRRTNTDISSDWTINNIKNVFKENDNLVLIGDMSLSLFYCIVPKLVLPLRRCCVL